MRLGIFVSFLFIYTFAYGQLKKPADLNDGIKTGTLSEVGIGEEMIREVETGIVNGFYPNIHSLLIYKDNKLVYENYFPGMDERWGDKIGMRRHSMNELHDVRSISKSVVSACIGLAIELGRIRSVEDPVFDYFKEYLQYDTGLKKQLRIRHLLSMTSGLEWNEEVPYDNPENSEIQMTKAKDPIEFVLSRKMVATPGKQWRYNGGTTQLLAAIIEKVSGRPVDQFAKEFLFAPLGIKQFEWVKYPGTNMPAAASGLRLRSRDMLKFGILYHSKGNYRGNQLLSAEWVKQSFHSQVERDGGWYGFQFWIWDEKLENKNVHIVAGVGNGDQRIHFDEADNLVVVVTAGNYNQWDIKNNSGTILRKIISAIAAR